MFEENKINVINLRKRLAAIYGRWTRIHEERTQGYLGSVFIYFPEQRVDFVIEAIRPINIESFIKVFSEAMKHSDFGEDMKVVFTSFDGLNTKAYSRVVMSYTKNGQKASRLNVSDLEAANA